MLDSEAILYYADHPVEFVEDVIGAKPDAQQAKILRSVGKNQLTTVRSGHGVGKSTVEAWVVIWFMVTRPFPKIPCTAPTQHQLFDILWAEVSKWLRHNKALSNELYGQRKSLHERLPGGMVRSSQNSQQAGRSARISCGRRSVYHRRGQRRRRQYI